MHSANPVYLSNKTRQLVKFLCLLLARNMARFQHVIKMPLPVSPTPQIVLSHNKLGKWGFHATLFRFQRGVWSKATHTVQILTVLDNRDFFILSCQKKDSIFISRHSDNQVLRVLPHYFSWSISFSLSLRSEDTESLAVRPYFDPGTWAGLQISLSRKKRFKQ